MAGERFHRRSAVCHSSKAVRVIEIVCVKRSGSGMVSLLNSLSFRINHLTYQNLHYRTYRYRCSGSRQRVWVRLSLSPAPDLQRFAIERLGRYVVQDAAVTRSEVGCSKPAHASRNRGRMRITERAPHRTGRLQPGFIEPDCWLVSPVGWAFSVTDPASWAEH